jgi:hypothetical protein
MFRKYFCVGILALALVLVLAPGPLGRPVQQSGFTLVGNWKVTSTPINGELVSAKGNTLGFPVRDMVFAQTGTLNTGMVLRDDIGPNVKPLGVWRVDGSNLSCAFELWCPDAGEICGSVVMRGSFTDASHISGTMAVYFTTPDDSNPTGLDTWVFAYTGVSVESF